MDVSDCDLRSLPETTIVQIIHKGERVSGEVQSRLKLIKYEIVFDENPTEKIIVSRSQIKTRKNTFKIGDAIELYRNQSTAKVCKILDYSVYLIVLLLSGQYEWYHRSEMVVRTNPDSSVEETTQKEENDKEGDKLLDDAELLTTDQNVSEAESENETKVEEVE